MSIITLTTDFGTADWFVGTMKGVILGINPQAALVDITHEVPCGDLRAGAFALAASCRFFPRGSVHVAVVDPGVGSPRAGLAVETADYFFVGPDNGVLSVALAQERVRAVRRLENPEYFLRPVSHTFHGRDIFAPVAAHLSAGLSLGKLGARQAECSRLVWPTARKGASGIHGEVVHVDRFGNAITNISNQLLGARLDGWTVLLRGKRLCPVKPFYQAVAPGQPVAVPGSSGFVEIAVNGGPAARRLGLKAGTQVAVRLRSKTG